MFHGGRNPAGRFMQESRITGYPNNYPVIDYDFQAPISRYGECRPHGDLLRLMHLFTQYFDTEICAKQAYFPKWSSSDPTDISFLKCSVRMDDQMSGYFFASTYEKGLQYKDFHNVSVSLNMNGKQLALPEIDVRAGAMFFYPFHIHIKNTRFDYILAQPIAVLEQNGETVCYFTECEGIKPKYSIGGAVRDIPVNEKGILIDDLKMIVLPARKARQLHIIGGKAVFSDSTVYCDKDIIYCEKKESMDLRHEIKLSPCKKISLPHSYYLYSTGKRQYYALEIGAELLENYFDIELIFDFSALNLQVFSGKTLINDYFNIDGRFIMRLREYKNYIQKGPLFIHTAERTKFGVGNVYQEIMPPKRKRHLIFSKINGIRIDRIDI